MTYASCRSLKGKIQWGKTGLWYRYGSAQAKGINSALHLSKRGKGNYTNPPGNSGGGNSVVTADIVVIAAIRDNASADHRIG